MCVHFRPPPSAQAAEKKERNDDPREGWEDGTPPPRKDSPDFFFFSTFFFSVKATFSKIHNQPMPAALTTTPLRPRFAACSAHAGAVDEPALSSSLRGGFSPTDVAQSLQTPAGEALAQARRTSEGSAPIAVIGGGVSGVFAALALRSLGYGSITVIEAAQRLGGKAASFDHGGFSFPIGAVSTPFALREASFTGAQILEKPLRFATSAFAHSRTKLQILDANNLLPRRLQGGTPRRFHASELSHGATESWKEAFSGTGPPPRFYPHHVDFASKPELA